MGMRVAGMIIGLALLGMLVWLAWPDAGADTPLDSLDAPRSSEPVATHDALSPSTATPAPSNLDVRPDDDSVDAVATAPAAREDVAEETVRELGVRGRVLGAHGRPAADARVRLHLSGPMRKRLDLADNYFMDDVPWDAFATTTTDADGRFALRADELAGRDGQRTRSTRLPEQTCVVVTHVGHQPRAVAVDRRLWDVDLGDIALEAGGVITGQVVDELGLPVSDALVLEPRMTRNGQGDASWGLVRDLSRTTTDAGGHFRLATHRPGSLGLGIRKPGFEPHVEHVTLHDHEDLDLGRIALSRGRVIHGHVVDEHGEPLAGVQLKLRPANVGFDFGGEDRALRDSVIRTISSRGPQEVTAVSDATGAFHCGELADAAYDVIAAHAGREPVIEREVTPDGPALRLLLASEALLVLTVLDDATGEPVADADPRMVRRSHAGEHTHADLDPGLEIDTGAAAAARLGRDDVGPGVYVGGPAGFLRHTVTVRAPQHAPVQVELPGVPVGEVLEHELRLGPGASVSGQVFDATGAPLADAAVEFTPDNADDDVPRKQREARADETGGFAWQGLAAGSWTLTVTAPGHVAPEPLAVTLAAGEQRDELSLHMQAAARIEGLLLDADGEPVGGWRVSARLGDGPTEQTTATRSGRALRVETRDAPASSSVNTNPDGTFVIDDLPPGDVTVSSQRAEPVSVTTSPEGPTPVTLQLHRPARLQGRVLEADGRPLPGVAVDVENDTESFAYERTETDSQGEYRFDDLDAGDWTVMAYDQGDASPKEQVSLRWGELAVVDVMYAGGRIRGRVLDVDGLGVEGVGVLATSESEPVRHVRATSGSEGHFEITRLAAGRWTVEVRAGAMIPVDLEPTVVELAENAEASCELRVRPGATLELRTHGQGLVSDTLHLVTTWAEDASITRFADLEPGETVRLVGLRPGLHHYTIKRPNNWPRPPDFEHVFASGSVEIVDGENQAEITLTAYTP